jgi:hypothetical protein
MNSLAQFDDNFMEPVALQTQARIANGFYTVTFPCGSHRTFRVYTRPARLCQACYQAASGLVRAGRATWRQLEEAGRARPRKATPFNRHPADRR